MGREDGERKESGEEAEGGHGRGREMRGRMVSVRECEREKYLVVQSWGWERVEES